MSRRNRPIDSEIRTVSALTVRVELPLSRIRNHRAEPRLPTISTSIAITKILISCVLVGKPYDFLGVYAAHQLASRGVQKHEALPRFQFQATPGSDSGCARWDRDYSVAWQLAAP